MEHVSTILPRALREMFVCRAHFQTAQHEAAWKSGTPLRTQRIRRWKVPRKWRDIVMRHDGWKCVHCGATSPLTIGHKVPVVFGGSNEPANLQTECLGCNLAQWTPELQRIADAITRDTQ